MIAAAPGSTTAELASRLNVGIRTAARQLEEMRYAGVVERQEGFTRHNPSQLIDTWHLASSPTPPADFAAIADEVIGVLDRHGRARLDEVEAALAGGHSKNKVRAVILRMLNDGVIDDVNFLIGRPDRVDDRTAFGRAVTALRTLTRPFERAEAALHLHEVPPSYVDTILMRACETGYLVKDGDHYRNVVRRSLRRPTREDVIGAFPKDGPTRLIDLRKRMLGVNTRPISGIVAELVESGEIIKTGHGAYVLLGAPQKCGELTVRGQIAALIRRHPDQAWSATKIAERLAVDVQDVRTTLSRLFSMGLVRRTRRGVYRHARRKRPAPGTLSRRAARPGRAEASRAAAADLVRETLLAAAGVGRTGEVRRATRLSAASFRGALALLIEKGDICTSGGYLVSLAPAARLDSISTPSKLLVLAAALVHGSINTAIDRGTLHRSDVVDRSIRSLLKRKLLVEHCNDLVPNSFPHLAPLRKVARLSGLGEPTRNHSS